MEGRRTAPRSFTTARGRDAVFWQSARTRKQARPQVRTPTARAAGIAELEIVVDSCLGPCFMICPFLTVANFDPTSGTTWRAAHP
ncbi:MAG TPA: hypothetical protein VJ757_13430 [Pseudonocardiaceae bacterium]|nr:hypothetical protein [Pseudonocardiaceae bacterium]